MSGPMNFDSAHFIPELTPLFGTSEYEMLTPKQRHRLFFEYLKLVGEALVLFEQILVYGVRALEKDFKNISPEASASLKQFAFEELYHSQAFRHFLHSNVVFNWDQKKIYADSRKLKNAIAWIVKKTPACVFLPGAKLEAFTLSYYRMIKKYYPDNRQNSWVHLNHIHQVDEAFHLPLEFDLHDSIFEKAGPVRTFLGTIAFVLIMQVALIIGSYKVIHYAMPEYSTVKKIRWMMKMAKWAVRTTPAYQEARQMTKTQFERKKPKWGKIFSFIYW